MISSPTPYPDAQSLKVSLAHVMRRLNLQRLDFYLSRVFAVSLLLAALIVFLHKTYLINSSYYVPAFIIFLSAAIGIEWWRRKKSNLFETALEADRRLGLKEKLSSGVAFADPREVRRRVRVRFEVALDRARHPAIRWVLVVWSRLLRVWAVILPPRYIIPSWAQREANSELVPALVADAAEQARGIKPRDVLPKRRTGYVHLLLSMEVAALGFLIFWGGKDLRPPEKRVVGIALAVEGKKLEDIAKQNKEAAKRDEKMSEAKKAALELAKLGKKMQDRRMPKKEALLKMDELSKELEKLEQKAAQKEEGKEITNLQKLAEALKDEQMADQNIQELTKSLAQQNMADAQNALEQMMQQMKSGKMTEAQKQQLAKDLEALSKGLDKAGNKKLAEQLRKMAQNIKAGNLSNIKMNAKDLANLLKNLQLSKDQLEALQQMAESLKQSSMNLAKADQKCELCGGTGKG